MKLQYVVLALVALAQTARADEYDTVGPIRDAQLRWPDGSIYGGDGYKSARIDVRYAYMVCDRTLYVAIAYGSATELKYSRAYYIARKEYDATDYENFEPDLDEEITVEAYGLTTGDAYPDTSFSCSDDRKSIVNVGWLIGPRDDLYQALAEMDLAGLKAALPLTNDPLTEEIRKRELDAINNGSSSYSGSSYSGSSSSSSSSGSYSGSSSSSGGTSGGAGQAVGAIGGLGGAALAGAGAGGSDDSSSSDDYDPLNPTQYDGPGLTTPAMAILEGSAVGIGLYFVFGYAMNKSLEARIDKKAQLRIAELSPPCEAGDTKACVEKETWVARIDPEKRKKLDWSASALLGPTFAYTFNAGYVREHRSGIVSTNFPEPVDAVMSGMAIDMTLRFQALRFQVGYQHMRGNLIGDLPDFMYQHTQGFDSLSTGAALQLGWHQAVSPYIGVRYRLDVQNGDFADDFNGSRNYTRDRIKSHLQGARSLGVLGATLNLPPARHRVMFRSFSLNLELYRGLEGTAIDSGVMVSAGMGAWVPGSVGAIKGMTGYDNLKTGAYGSWLVPTISRGGVGLEIVSIDSGHQAVTAVDGWIKPSAEGSEAGVALGGWGFRQKLPGATHALAFKATPFSISRWRRDEALGISADDPADPYDDPYDRGKLKVYAFGQLRLEYHAVIHSHLAEVGIRMPLFWWTNRGSNKLGFSDAKLYEGSMPMMAFAGFGF